MKTCAGCGTRFAKSVSLEFKGEQLMDTMVCHVCLDEFWAKLEEQRIEFQALLEDGMSREDANVEMIRRMESR